MIRALTWNLFHGRDYPPDPALLTLALAAAADDRARTRPTCRSTATSATSSPAMLGGADWDVALLQECPPRWARGARRRAAAPRRTASLTSRNSLAPAAAARSRAAQPGPDRLLRGRLEPDPRPRRQIDRAARARARPRAAARAADDGLHPALDGPATRSASPTCTPAPGRPARHAEREVLAAAERARASGPAATPLIFGGDLNLRPREHRRLRRARASASASRAPTAPGRRSTTCSRAGSRSSSAPRRGRRAARGPPSGGLAIRLSDHAPVQARFRHHRRMATIAPTAESR